MPFVLGRKLDQDEPLVRDRLTVPFNGDNWRIDAMKWSTDSEVLAHVKRTGRGPYDHVLRIDNPHNKDPIVIREAVRLEVFQATLPKGVLT